MNTRPSIAFATISAFVIGGNLFLISAFIAAIFTQPDPFVILGGLFVVPLSVLLAVQQYRGTFRRLPSAAKTAGVLLFLTGGFWLFAAITTAGEAILEGVSLRPLASLLIPMLVLAALAVALGRMNALWCSRLRAATAAGAIPSNQLRFSLRELLLAVGVIAFMTGITSQFIRTAPPRYAEHVEPSAAPFRLPFGARDVSYCKGARGTIAFEFTIHEIGFRDWVDSGIGSIESDSAGVPLREITTPFTITRYFAYSPALSGPDDVTINNGLYYKWFKEDRGVYAAFDRGTGRAYYHAHSH